MRGTTPKSINACSRPRRCARQPSQVLQRVVDLSRQLSQARYAALGVLDADGGHIEQFITSGVTPEERGTMGDPPQGHGLLGAILTERRPMRVDVIQNDPRSG